MAARPYNILSICAGVGGLELGVRIARSNARAVCYIEREIPAATVLAARIKDGSLHDAPIWTDLTTFDPEPWRGLVDCITSGDPCQPNSVAGLRLGKDDDRWLLDHIMRIVEVVRPHRFFRENVPGNASGQLEYLIPALERMGRRVAVGIFSAGEDAEAAHRRERLFLMADLSGCERERGSRGAGLCGASDSEGGRSTGLGLRGEGLADYDDPRRNETRFGKSDESERRECVSGDGRIDVAHDASERRGKTRRTGNSERSEKRPGDRSAFRADGYKKNDHTASSFEGGTQKRKRIRTDNRSASGDMAHADGVGRRKESNEEQSSELAYQSDFRRPLFAPGPSDPRWSEILYTSPHLAPALSDFDATESGILREIENMGSEGDATQIESVIRRVDARMAQRVDRLRQCGNGVSSMASAIAWRTLEAKLYS